MNNAIHTEIPEQLWQQAQALIQQGWANNLQELINEALRRYLESHQDVQAETFTRNDVEWGLQGGK